MDVAEAAYDKLVTNLHVDDRGFLMNFAFVESDYGTKIFDYYDNVAQIWPLRKELFQKTKLTTLSKKHSQILSEFGIDWIMLQYHELNVPLFSCLAMDLYLDYINAYPMPYGDEEQSKIYEEITVTVYFS